VSSSAIARKRAPALASSTTGLQRASHAVFRIARSYQSLCRSWVVASEDPLRFPSHTCSPTARTSPTARREWRSRTGFASHKRHRASRVGAVSVEIGRADHGRHLANDTHHAPKARAVTDLCREARVSSEATTHERQRDRYDSAMRENARARASAWWRHEREPGAVEDTLASLVQ